MYSHGTHHSNRQNLRHLNCVHLFMCMCVRERALFVICSAEAAAAKIRMKEPAATTTAVKRTRDEWVNSRINPWQSCTMWYILWLMKWIKVNAKRRNILSKLSQWNWITWKIAFSLFRHILIYSLDMMRTLTHTHITLQFKSKWHFRPGALAFSFLTFTHVSFSSPYSSNAVWVLYRL